jgi:hypothetical protein
MKKYIAVVVAAGALAAALIIPATALANPYDAITSSGNNGAFTINTSCSSVANVHNGNIRFGQNGGIAIPGTPQTGATVGDIVAGEAVAAPYSSPCGGNGFVGAPALYEP